MSNTTDILAALQDALPGVRWRSDRDGVRATVAGLEAYVVDHGPPLGLAYCIGRYRGFAATPAEAAQFVVCGAHTYAGAFARALRGSSPRTGLFAEAR